MQRRTRLLVAALAATTALGLLPTAAGAAPQPAQLHTVGPTGQLTSTGAFTPPGATPILGHFDEADGQDILWYTPGPGGDAFWSGHEDGTWEASTVSINGTYTPHVGNFGDEDKGDDILWYSATGASQLWNHDGDGGVSKIPLPTIGGSGQVLVGDFTSDGVTDLIRYRPGSPAEQWWDFDEPTGVGEVAFTIRSFSVSGTYQPVVGSFHQDPNLGDHGDDIIWYAPGKAADSVWDFNANGTYTPTPTTIDGTYRPLVGRFMASVADQVIWYAPGKAGDSLWTFDGAHAVTKKALTINGTYTPYTCECVKSGLGDRDDIVWHGVGSAPDSIWSMNGSQFSPTSHGYPNGAIRGSKVATPYAVDGFQQSLLTYG